MADRKTPQGWSTRPWSRFNKSDYKTAEQFCRACIIDLNPKLRPNQPKVKSLCFLPYKEPDGTPNVNGLLATAGGRGLMRIRKPEGLSNTEWAAVRRAAARKIIRLYRRSDALHLKRFSVLQG